DASTAEQPVEGACEADPDVLWSLSRMRTDLDCFSEVEAYSLMQAAYAMSAVDLARCPGMGELILAPEPQKAYRWRFLQVAPWLRRPTPQYRRLLQGSRRRFFRLFWLSRPLTLLIASAAAACLVGIGAW